MFLLSPCHSTHQLKYFALWCHTENVSYHLFTQSPSLLPRPFNRFPLDLFSELFFHLVPLPWLLSYWEMLLNIPYVIRWGQDAVSGWPPPIAAAVASLIPKRFITASWGSWVLSTWALHVDTLYTFIDNKNTFHHWVEVFSNPHQDIPCVAMYKIYWLAVQNPQDLILSILCLYFSLVSYHKIYGSRQTVGLESGQLVPPWPSSTV